MCIRDRYMGCGNNERIEMMESTDLTHWNEFSSSEVTYSGTTLFPMQIDPASKRIFFANRIEDGHYLESTVFEYRLGGSFVKKGTFLHKSFIWQKIGLFNRAGNLHLLRLTSNNTNFIKDRFFEFEVDSPSKIQNLPLPVLNEGPFHFQFNYYKDDIILTVNFNGWYVRQYKMKA
eukprot:TRINITY_DN6112_c0_g1_i7.p1 TRINITY_DN6112_c0_g1~~TRINITY_DN6112_c0_g1_i7.p1  ORF type:complete len:175 (+),score=15.88 TRINITY_DN6112_c0_g1_i7:91-615(+)